MLRYIIQFGALNKHGVVASVLRVCAKSTIAAGKKIGQIIRHVLLQLPFSHTFAIHKMVIVAQLVRASDCGSEGRGFEPRLSP
jgi:hypothetical protein